MTSFLLGMGLLSLLVAIYFAALPVDEAAEDRRVRRRVLSKDRTKR